MIDDMIARINELAKKAKGEGLTQEEVAERDRLRRIYLDSVRANLTARFAPQAAGLPKMFRDRTISPNPVGADLCVRPWWAVRMCTA